MKSNEACAGWLEEQHNHLQYTWDVPDESMGNTISLNRYSYDIVLKLWNDNIKNEFIRIFWLFGYIYYDVWVRQKYGIWKLMPNDPFLVKHIKQFYNYKLLEYKSPN